MYLDQLIQYFNNVNTSRRINVPKIQDAVMPKIQVASNIEFELKLILEQRKNILPYFIKVVDKATALNKYKELFVGFSDNYSVINKQTINFINSKSNTIKELHFTNGKQDKEKKRFYVKKRLHTPIFMCVDKDNFKISLSDEIDITETEFDDYDITRFKQRFSFIADEWSIDFTFVKSTESKSLADLVSTRDKLFVDITPMNIFTDKLWIWEYVDSIEVEFEYMNSNKPLMISSIKQVINYAQKYDVNANDENDQCTQNSHDDQCDQNHDSLLTKINNIFVRGQSGQGQRQNETIVKDTLKKILPNAIEINKKQYFEEILPMINDFYLTDKADGLRTLLIVNKDIISVNSTSTVLESNIYFNIGETIVECELIDGIFYAFDILKYDGVDCINKNFENRLKILTMLTDEGDSWGKLKIKEFIKLSKETYQNDIREFVKDLQKRDYYCDGIIFTSISHIYKSTKFYKWKPPLDMTIDFIAKKCPNELLGCNPYKSKEGYDLYLLFSGITLKEYKKLNMKTMDKYKTIFSSRQNNATYFPIQFSPSDNPIAYLFWHPSNSEFGNLDNKIVELRLQKECNTWELIRIREDRVNDFKKKNYFGNNFRVAELIWRNYSNPLTLDLICSDISDLSTEFYFRKHNSNEHMAVRKFNNMVKYELLKHLDSSIDENSWAVDLGAGKGNDLLKYTTMKNIKNVLFIDSNDNNLCSIIERKYNYVNDKKKDGSSMGIFIKKLDLNDEWESNHTLIKEHNPFLQKSKTKLIVCNFAIHYFAKNSTTIANFVELVDSLLADGGRFLFTCMNGEAVFNLLRKSGNGNEDDKKYSAWGDGNKYFIKMKNKASKFQGGEEIEILLPFSDGALFKEYLVNLKLIEKEFKKKKIKLESQANFGSNYLNKFQEYYPYIFNKMDDADKEYIKLLDFSIYHKNTKPRSKT